MKDDNASERAAALVNQAIDVLRRTEHAPGSPVNVFLPAKRRREFRRTAARLRQGKARPRYLNLYTAERLADILEMTVRRDEIIQQAGDDLRRITLDLGRLIDTNGAEVGQAMNALIGEMQRSARQHGPGSEAAHRYRLLCVLGWMGRQSHAQKRRQRTQAPPFIPLAPDPSVEARNQVTAAEILPSLPSSDEPVIAIPPDGSGGGRKRLLMRIGIGKASWIGSFERGHARGSTVCLLPDERHLFVSAGGAGYIIDARSRTLVEATGTEVVEVIENESRTVFIVNHGHKSLEIFGRNGRLWDTGILGCGGFRRIDLTDAELHAEALHLCRGTRVHFSANLATGEVRIEETAGRGE